MKKALLVVCAVVCSIFYVSAQQYQDVVYLKNGSIVRGVILEQIPGKSIKIATDNGSQLFFKIEDIEKMTKELPQQSQQQYQQQQPQYQQQYRQPQPAPVARAPRAKSTIDWSPRYKGEFNIGYAIAGSKFDWEGDYEVSSSGGENESGSESVGKMKTVFSRPLFETIHGAQIGPYFFVGAGIGLQYYCGKVKDAKEWFSVTQEVYDNVKRWNAVMLPIFANIKFMYPVTESFAPYLNLGLGGTIGCHSAFNDSDSGSEEFYGEYYNWDVSMRARGGFYCDLGAGFRYKALNFGLGLQHQVFKMVYNSSDSDYSGKYTYKTKINSFYVKLGLNF